MIGKLKVSLFLLLVLLSASRGAAQDQIKTGTLTSTTCPGSGCVDLTVAGAGTGGIQIAGTWSAFPEFYGSINCTDYKPLSVNPLEGGTAATGTSFNGAWLFSAAGLCSVRVQASTFTSGTVNVAIRVSTGTALSPSSSGGGGVVTQAATWFTAITDLNATDFAKVTPASTAPVAVDPALVVSLSPNGRTVTANLGTLNGAATAAQQTDGTQKAIARGGAKGATAAADLTSTAEGADHQALDVQTYHGTVAIDPRSIRALTSADVVDVSDRGGRALGSIANTTFGQTNWLGSTAPTVGPKSGANSIPVIISGDQTTLPVAGTVDVNSGVIAHETSGYTVGAFNSSSVPGARISGGAANASTARILFASSGNCSTSSTLHFFFEGTNDSFDYYPIDALMAGIDTAIGATNSPTRGEYIWSPVDGPVLLSFTANIVGFNITSVRYASGGFTLSCTMTVSIMTIAAPIPTDVRMQQNGAFSAAITDGTDTADVTAGSTAAVAANKALVVSLSPNRSNLTANAPATGSIGVASAALVASNAARKGLVIVNLSSNTCSFGIGATAVLNSGITLQAGAAWTLNEFTFTNGAINAICSAASSTLSVQEFQ